MPAALGSGPQAEPRRAQVPSLQVPALLTWCRLSSGNPGPGASPRNPFVGARRARAVRRVRLGGGGWGSRAGAGYMGAGGEAPRGGVAAGVSAFRGGPAGRQRGPLSLGGRSAGRRDRLGSAGAKVAAQGSAPPAGRVRVRVPGRAPPRLLPAAFWRASPPGPRRGRLPETGRRPDAGALLLCPRPLGRLRGTSKGAREPGSGAEMRRPRAHSFLSLPQRIFRVSLLRPHRRRTLRAGRLGSEAQKKGRAS